jgi:hypothetical protein
MTIQVSNHYFQETANNILSKLTNGCPKITPNACIYATKNKTMKATALGIWYMQIPYNFIIDPQGNVIEPKIHNGSKFVWVKRERRVLSKIPKMNYEQAMKFKEIFCD